MRLQTDKKLQMMVGIGAVVVLVLLVGLMLMKSSSSQTAAPSPDATGMAPMPGGGPGGMAPAPGGMPGAPAAAPATTAPTTDTSTATASATPSGAVPASVRKGAPTVPYRPDPFQTIEGGQRVSQMINLPRIQLPRLTIRRPNKPRPIPIPRTMPITGMRVAAIMLGRSVSAILEEEGSTPKIVQPGDPFTRGNGTTVRVEKIEPDSVTIRDGRSSVRIPLKGSDIAQPDNTQNQTNTTPGMGYPGMPGGMPGGMMPGGMPGGKGGLPPMPGGIGGGGGGVMMPPIPTPMM